MPWTDKLLSIQVALMELRSSVTTGVACSIVLTSYVCYEYFFATGRKMGHLAFANV
jgi:hypothetical protein